MNMQCSAAEAEGHVQHAEQQRLTCTIVYMYMRVAGQQRLHDCVYEYAL